MRPQNKHLVVSRRFQERFAELQAELEATGIPLTARERVDLDMAVTLSLRRSRSVHDHVQAASTAKRLLDPLYARRAKAAADAAPLRERIAEQA